MMCNGMLLAKLPFLIVHVLLQGKWYPLPNMRLLQEWWIAKCYNQLTKLLNEKLLLLNEAASDSITAIPALVCVSIESGGL